MSGGTREGGTSASMRQAWWQLLKKGQDVAPLQLATDNHLTCAINAMHLERIPVT
jgi:hypothetical protein